MKSIKEHRLLILLLFIALFLTNFNNGAYELSSDEYITLNISQGIDVTSYGLNKTTFNTVDSSYIPFNYFKKENTLKNVVKITEHDNGNSLLYNLSLHGWLTLSGVSVSSARSFSAFCSVGSIFIFYLLCFKITKNKVVSILASGILLVHPLFLHYAHTARAYSLTLLFVITLLYYCSILYDSNEKKPSALFLYYTILGILFGLMLLSHYLSLQVVLLVSTWLFIVKVFYQKNYQTILGLGISSLLAVAIFGSWYFYFGEEGKDIMATQNEVIKLNTPPNFTPSATGLLFGITSQINSIAGNYLGMMGFKVKEIIALLIFPLLFIIMGFPEWLNAVTKRYWSLFLGMIVMNLLFNSFLALKAGHNVSFWPRYAIFSIPSIAFLYAIALYSLPTLSMTRKIIGVISSCIIGLTFAVSSIPAFTGYLGSFDQAPALRNKLAQFSFTDYHQEPYEYYAQQLETSGIKGDTIQYQSEEIAQNILIYLNHPEHYSNYINSGASNLLRINTTVVAESIPSPHIKK